MMIGLDMSEFTFTERRLLEVLSDGRIHTAAELIDKCMDELTDVSVLYVHVTNLRKKVTNRGLLLVSMANGCKEGRGYQMSRRLHVDD
jgi:DNA-binding response OmpR family regulator